MVIFISGSVNSGKSTTSKLLADKIGAKWVDVDEIANLIPNFDLSKDIPKAIELTIKHINRLAADGHDVVANYVLRKKDYEKIKSGLTDNNQYYLTLSPKIEEVLQDRGRGINKWELERIKYHYESGIANPDFGDILDTSNMSIEEVVNEILNRLKIRS